jgi:CBS domain-containing membrane protein
VIGGGLVDPAGWWFPLAPVALDAVLLVGVGLLFHRLSGHPYPHPHPSPAPAREAPAPAPLDVSDADLDAVLARVGETFDIDREDLRLLLAELEVQVQSRPG